MEKLLEAALAPAKPTSRDGECTSLLGPAAPYTHVSEKIHKNESRIDGPPLSPARALYFDIPVS